ncbi:TraB/GumN family protein [Arenimonas sp.]|uniref:TraB/GumN family protein n=1 Tax=Arenimonas sp. TaxID=1872635 RepID=UPI0035ADD11A
MRLAWIACLLCLTLLAGCARAEPPRPLLWKVSDADNSVYLLGSFHLLRPGDYPLAASTDLAFEDAESVVFELSPSEMNDPALGQMMGAAARREDGKRLQDTLAPETWAQLQAWAQRRAVPLENLQGFDAWFVSLTISLVEMQALGLDPKMGLDRHFAQRATEAGKPAEGLETGAAQIALFDGMDPRLQQQSLEDVLSDAGEMEQNINRLHELWRRGDVAGLEAETNERMRDEYPELYARINRDRNLAWLPVIRQRLDRGGSDEDVLVVVGAMHLLGEDGLVALLRGAGYTVERL